MTVPNVADGQLIATSWGNTVATDVNSHTAQLSGAQRAGAILLPSTNPTNVDHAVRKGYVDTIEGYFVRKSGGPTGGDMFGFLFLPSSFPTDGRHATHKAYVDAQDGLRVAVSGDTMTGQLVLDTTDYTGNNVATRRQWQLATFVQVSGDAMTGNLNMSGNLVTGLGTPTTATHAATKEYVDNAIADLRDELT